MPSRNRRYPADFSNARERFLSCSPKMHDGQQSLTREGVPQWVVQTLEDVDMGGYQTTDDKQQVILASARPVSFPKYTPVEFVNPVVSHFSFKSNRGEMVSGITIYVDDVVAVEAGDAA